MSDDETNKLLREQNELLKKQESRGKVRYWSNMIGCVVVAVVVVIILIGIAVSGN